MTNFIELLTKMDNNSITTTQDELQKITLELIDELELSIEDIMSLTDLSKATIKKFMKNQRVAGATVCKIFDKVKCIYVWEVK